MFEELDTFAFESDMDFEFTMMALEADAEAANEEKKEDAPASPEKKKNFIKKIWEWLKGMAKKIGAIFGKKLRDEILMAKIKNIDDGANYKVNWEIIARAMLIDKEASQYLANASAEDLEKWQSANDDSSDDSTTFSKVGGKYTTLQHKMANAIVDVTKKLNEDGVDPESKKWQRKKGREVKKILLAFAKEMDKKAKEVEKAAKKQAGEATKAAETPKKQNKFVKALKWIWSKITWLPRTIGGYLRVIFGSIKKDKSKNKEDKKTEAKESFTDLDVDFFFAL